MTDFWTEQLEAELGPVGGMLYEEACEAAEEYGDPWPVRPALRPVGVHDDALFDWTWGDQLDNNVISEYQVPRKTGRRARPALHGVQKVVDAARRIPHPDDCSCLHCKRQNPGCDDGGFRSRLPVDFET